MTKRADARITGVVVGAALVYALVLAAVTVLQYEAFASGFDHGIFTRYVWELGHLRAPFNTVNLRWLPGDHIEPFLAILGPLGVLGVAGVGLLLVQAFALAGTAPALLALARALGADGWLAAVVPLLWLCSPAVVGANLSEFHPETVVPLLVTVGALALVRDRVGWFALTVILACSVKEDVALTYAAAGLVLVWAGRQRLGWMLVGFCGAWFAFATFVVLPASGPAVAEEFGPRFAGSRGSTVLEAVRYEAIHPLHAVTGVFANEKLGIIAVLIASTGGLCLLGYRWALVATPALLANMLSDYPPQHSLAFQYFVVPMGVLAAAGAVGAAIAARERVARAPLLGFAAVAGVILLGLSVAGVQASARVIRENWGKRSDRQSIIDLVPAGARIAAPTGFLAHLADRERVYLAPEPLRAVQIGTPWNLADRRVAASRLSLVILDSSMGYGGGTTYRQVLRTVEESGFEPVARRGGVVLYGRGTGAGR